MNNRLLFGLDQLMHGIVIGKLQSFGLAIAFGVSYEYVLSLIE